MTTVVLPDGLERIRHLAGSVVTPVPGRCVQCGTCNHSCPLGIDVRGHVRQGRPVGDRRCLACGSCVARCPRDAVVFMSPGEAP